MKTIDINAAFWHEIKNQISVYREIKALLIDFDFGKYNNNDFDLLIILQAFPTDYTARKVEEYKRMRRKTKTLELYLVLDYQTVKNNSDEENLQYMKDVFLKGCETFLKDMKGFEWEAFSENMKMVLN